MFAQSPDGILYWAVNKLIKKIKNTAQCVHPTAECWAKGESSMTPAAPGFCSVKQEYSVGHYQVLNAQKMSRDAVLPNQDTNHGTYSIVLVF